MSSKRRSKETNKAKTSTEEEQKCKHCEPLEEATLTLQLIHRLIMICSSVQGSVTSYADRLLIHIASLKFHFSSCGVFFS